MRMQIGQPALVKPQLPARDEILTHGVWALAAFQLSPSSSNSSIRARLTCAAGTKDLESIKMTRENHDRD